MKSLLIKKKLNPMCKKKKKKINLDYVLVCFLRTSQCPRTARFAKSGWVVQAEDLRLQIFSEASL